MTFSQNFVLAVKDQNRRILREIEGKVYLPFHSEYSLLLKNTGWKRGLCTVSIDGTDVLGGHELIIDGGTHIDLERFLVDGDLNRGQRFKFVPAGDGRVQDPTAGENGIVEVKFWVEIQPPPPPHYLSAKSIPLRSVYPDSGTAPNASVFYCSTSADLGASDMSSYTLCNDSPSQKGATVAGSNSNQQFSTGYFRGKDGPPVVLRLQLLGHKESVTTTDTRHQHCDFCGKRVPWGNQYCGGCGARVGVLI